MIHKASMNTDSRIITNSLPKEGDTIETDNFGTATIEKLFHNEFDNFIDVTWDKGNRRQTYRFSVE